MQFFSSTKQYTYLTFDEPTPRKRFSRRCKKFQDAQTRDEWARLVLLEGSRLAWTSEQHCRLLKWPLRLQLLKRIKKDFQTGTAVETLNRGPGWSTLSKHALHLQGSKKCIALTRMREPAIHGPRAGTPCMTLYFICMQLRGCTGRDCSTRRCLCSTAFYFWS